MKTPLGDVFIETQNPLARYHSISWLCHALIGTGPTNGPDACSLFTAEIPSAPTQLAMHSKIRRPSDSRSEVSSLSAPDCLAPPGSSLIANRKLLFLILAFLCTRIRPDGCAAVLIPAMRLHRYKAYHSLCHFARGKFNQLS